MWGNTIQFIKDGPTERKSETSMSREDQKFMKILQNGAKLRNNHYHVALPFKDPCVNFPNNRYKATQRLSYLGEKISKNDQEIKNISSFWKDFLPNASLCLSSKQAWKHKS